MPRDWLNWRSNRPSTRQGLATYLLGESFRHLHDEGLAVIEAQVWDTNLSARGLLGKLGFEQVDESLVFRKELVASGESHGDGSRSKLAPWHVTPTKHQAWSRTKPVIFRKIVKSSA